MPGARCRGTGRHGPTAAWQRKTWPLLLDGMVVKTGLDKKATARSVLVALAVRRDGQKVLVARQHMAGESRTAWRQFLENPDGCGQRQPALVTIDGAPGLEAAGTALRVESLPMQRCTVHRHRNLLAHGSTGLPEELQAGYRGRSMRLLLPMCRSGAQPCCANANGDASAVPLPPALKKLLRAALLHPCTRFLLASGQMQMGKVEDGWAHLAQPIQPFTLDPFTLDLAA